MFSIANANQWEEVFDMIKHELTHIECTASGKSYRTMESSNLTVDTNQTDYFSFNDEFLFLRPDSAGHGLVVVMYKLPGEEKLQIAKGYELSVFNDNFISIDFIASKEFLKRATDNDQISKKFNVAWSINRNTGGYKTSVDNLKYMRKLSADLFNKTKSTGSCKKYDPNIKKF